MFNLNKLMPMPTKQQYGFMWTAADRRMLVQKLEKYYVLEQKHYLTSLELLHADAKKTKRANYDRRFRLRIKPIEMVLYMLGSEFMSNVKPPSIRRTFELAARDNRAFQSKETITRYMRKAIKKRDS